MRIAIIILLFLASCSVKKATNHKEATALHTVTDSAYHKSSEAVAERIQHIKMDRAVTTVQTVAEDHEVTTVIEEFDTTTLVDNTPVLKTRTTTKRVFTAKATETTKDTARLELKDSTIIRDSVIVSANKTTIITQTTKAEDNSKLSYTPPWRYLLVPAILIALIFLYPLLPQIVVFLRGMWRGR